MMMIQQDTCIDDIYMERSLLITRTNMERISLANCENGVVAILLVGHVRRLKKAATTIIIDKRENY